MNIFILSPQLYSVYLMKLLEENHGYNPVLFFTNSESRKVLLREFPKVEQQDYLKACKGEQIKTFSILDNCLNLRELQFLKQYLHIALHMMERNDSNARDFGFQSREEFFFKQAKYYKNLILSLNINTILFEEEPHQVNDFIIYLIAKLLKCDTLMAVRSIAHLGIVYKDDYTDTKSYVADSQNKKRLLKEELFNELTTDIRNYYTKIQGSYENVIKEHLWDQFDRLENKKQNNSNSGFFKIIKKFTIFFNVKNYLKLGRLPFVIFNFESDQKVKSKNLQESKQNYLSFRLQKYFTINQKRKLENYYHKNSTKIDKIKNKYVLLALQYQPEKSTCPLANEFVNQNLILECLLASLPANVNVVVREHPSQFVSDYTRYGECYRSKQFYDNLIENDRVFLSDLNDDVFDLIDKSLGVCSAGGTILWEARIRGKVALNFAHAWFNAMDGIYFIKNQCDLDHGVKAILNNTTLSEIACLLFLRNYCRNSEIAAIGGKQQLEYFCLTPEENAKKHFLAIEKFFRRR